MDFRELHLEDARAIIQDLFDSRNALDLLLKTEHAYLIEWESLYPSFDDWYIQINGSEISQAHILQLVEKARKARKHSYAPYSHFNVGAAILAERRRGMRKKIFSGCNIENAAYSPTICGEITAAVKAVSAGYRRFLAYAMVGGFDDSVSSELRAASLGEYVTSCGRCRQFTKEFDADPCMVVVAPDQGPWLISTLEFLLPAGFGPKNLGADPADYSRHMQKKK